MLNSVYNHFESTNQSDRISKINDLKLKIIIETLSSITTNNNSKLQNLTLLLLVITEFGFINNSIRRKCWYHILNRQLNRVEGEDDVLIKIKAVRSSHKDENQVKLDTNRSFGYIEDPIIKKRLKPILHDIIINVLQRNPQLHYYQGFHEIASIFVMIYYENIAKKTNIRIKLMKIDQC